jgi:hypothetical protein
VSFDQNVFLQHWPLEEMLFLDLANFSRARQRHKSTNPIHKLGIGEEGRDSFISGVNAIIAIFGEKLAIFGYFDQFSSKTLIFAKKWRFSLKKSSILTNILFKELAFSKNAIQSSLASWHSGYRVQKTMGSNPDRV